MNGDNERAFGVQPFSGEESTQIHHQEGYLQFKGYLHQRLIDRVEEIGADFASLRKEAVMRFVTLELDRLHNERPFPLSEKETETLIEDLANELTGFGPLEAAMQDSTVEDILVNGPREIYLGRAGTLQISKLAFQDDAHLMRIIHRLLAMTGRRIDESSPTVDARLTNIGRLNVVIPPLALNGPVMSIRRFPAHPLGAGDLVEKGTLTQPMLEFLQLAVTNRCNILISGGTSSGKTTFLNVIASFIPDGERVITIEDTAELQLQSKHVVRLESRPGGHDGAGAVDVRDLLRNTLRMRPDRIVIGEVRGGEALEMMQAMTTGHDGSLGTIHANSAREALQRLEILLSFGGFPGNDLSMRRQIASAIEIIVQIARLPDGRRRVIAISEVTGVGDNIISMQEHFRYEAQEDRDGKLQDHWTATGITPRTPKLAKYQPTVTDDDFGWR
ncbi:CpaF family protein [Acidithiobacillus sp. HP-6]|uniref:CpaF family protein n=1 Tax=unclassified Acidithiobacillus TaxID=2614800 RepID=UPI001879D167|nr:MULTISPECIES: CpaF family protein [unclassified Acidithiobacillus]MBE7564025.1 CpaF family protein [Acidithiobacillus sp. HP-6]MBE7569584.1 CpaF family protein [Acidithiobacillus sp. HP-2]